MGKAVCEEDHQTDQAKHSHDTFFLFFFLFWLLHDIWKFPGQRSDSSHSCLRSCSCGNTRFLTHCAGQGIEPGYHCSQDAPSPLYHSRNSMIHFFVCLFVCFLGPHPAYGSSQARGRIGAVATNLHHRHSNAGSFNPLSEARY